MNDNIILFPPKSGDSNNEEDDISEDGIVSGEVKCLACGHIWVGTVPVNGELPHLECPKCSLTQGFFNRRIEASDGDIVYICVCDCEFFSFLKNRGARCVRCGLLIDFNSLFGDEDD